MTTAKPLLPGLGLDIVAAVLAAAGGLLCHWLWPSADPAGVTDPADAAGALTVLGVFLAAAAVCEVGAILIRGFGGQAVARRRDE